MKAPPSPTVATPVMYHRWLDLTFLHWRYEPDDVQALLPAGLTVETCDGSAWVGLVPFLMTDVRAPAVPALPWLSKFPETNVRTYVRDERGRSGIWFFSLDAARLPAVLAARAGFWLPYYWSDMAVDASNGAVAYRSSRRWPGPTDARCNAEVTFGRALEPAELDELTHFLTARFRLFSVVAGKLVAAEVEHPPWPLHRADLLWLDQNVIEAAGLPKPSGDALVHASPGVAVRIGMWHS